MSTFNVFDDTDSPENVNIADGTDPTKKVSLTNSELNVNDTVNLISTPIHTAVGLTAVQIDSPILANRKEVILQANKDLYIGFSNGVTTSNYAHFIRKGQIVDFVYGPSIQLWAIATTTGSTSDAVVTQGAKS